MKNFSDNIRPVIKNDLLLTEILKLMDENPNDQVLGKKIREYLSSRVSKPINIEYIDNSHEKGY